MTERVINLSAAEAKAFAAGATALIRPLDTSRIGPDIRAVRWQAGDALILREAWDIADINEQEVMIRYWCGGPGWKATLPTPSEWRPLLANHEWVRSPSTMPKALARHRYPVLSVRVCKALDLTHNECRAASWNPDGWIRSNHGPDLSIGAGIRSIGAQSADSWVSVTILDRSAT